VIDLLLQHWEAICGLVFAVLSYFAGKSRERTLNMRRVDSVTPVLRKRGADGFAGIGPVVALLCISGGSMACSSSITDRLRDTVIVSHLATRKAVEKGMPLYEARCKQIATQCGTRGDTVCAELTHCHQGGDTIMTAYSAANNAMALALISIASIELLNKALEDAAGKSRLELEQEREQLLDRARRQLRIAEKHAKETAAQLERLTIL